MASITLTTILAKYASSSSSTTSCGESCGWLAALGAVLSFGSFGVPIKSKTCHQLQIDPLVFQSYKTAVCLVTSGILLTCLGIPLQFTPWGIVSGLFWVPGGIACVAAIQLAGLAVAIAVGNSCIALVSFAWGIFFFHELVQSQLVACGGVLIMILGFSGMSYFSTRDEEEAGVVVAETKGVEDLLLFEEEEVEMDGRATTSNHSSSSPPSHESVELITEARRNLGEKTTLKKKHSNNIPQSTSISIKTNIPDNIPEDDTSSPATAGLRHRHAIHLHHHSNEISLDPPADPDPNTIPKASATLRRLDHSNSNLPYTTTSSPSHSSSDNASWIQFIPQSRHSNPHPNDPFLEVRHFRNNNNTNKSNPPIIIIVSRRHAGMALAAFNGCWGGSVLVPMKFCPVTASTSGIGYVWSFGVGATLVTLSIWIFRFLWILVGLHGTTTTTTTTGGGGGGSLRTSFIKAYEALPPLHLKQMWRPGGLSGLLWSIGNVCSILSVDYLGEGVGYCVVQASMLVSGLWGIFYFHEVKGASTIVKWFLSALLTVSGILLLSYEHHASAASASASSKA